MERAFLSELCVILDKVDRYTNQIFLFVGLHRFFGTAAVKLDSCTMIPSENDFGTVKNEN